MMLLQMKVARKGFPAMTCPDGGGGGERMSGWKVEEVGKERVEVEEIQVMNQLRREWDSFTFHNDSSQDAQVICGTDFD